MDSASARLTQILEALRVIHNPTSPNESRQQAQQFVIGLEEKPDVCQIAFQVLQNTGDDFPQAKHFGFQLLAKSLRKSWNQWGAQQHQECKNLLLNLLSAPLLQKTGYVRNKYAEAFVECIKRVWPQQWPELMPRLLQDPQNVTAMVILRLLGDSIADEISSRDLPLNRKKEIVKALFDLKEQFFTFVSSTPLAQEQVLWIRSYSAIYGVASMLQKNVEQFLVQALQPGGDLRLKEEAILTFAEWSTTPVWRFRTKISGATNTVEPTADCASRLVHALEALGRVSVGSRNAHQSDLDDEDFALARQVATIVKDFVQTNAESLNRELPNTLLQKLWDLLLELARYPS